MFVDLKLNNKCSLPIKLTSGCQNPLAIKYGPTARYFVVNSRICGHLQNTAYIIKQYLKVDAGKLVSKERTYTSHIDLTAKFITS